jgi:Ser/Thr protein kinase RdoA (MazF antagonist)
VPVAGVGRGFFGWQDERMPVRAFATHDLEVGEYEVVKRFRSSARGEHRREWHALVTLDAYAPGLAPAPLGCDLDSSPPQVRMSRVAGCPLAGQVVTAVHLDAVAAAIDRLHAAVPAEVAGAVRPQPWLAAGVRSRLESYAAVRCPGDADRVVRSAFDAAVRWLAHVAEPDLGAVTPVFGQGDGNLANYLWDGRRVRLVDFEDSGRSDRAFELAAVAEHLSVWHDAGVGTAAFLARFELTPAQAARVLFFRRAFAFFWLVNLLGAGDDRLDALRAQALRLLAMLDTG